jgi:hypothetical protein
MTDTIQIDEAFTSEPVGPNPDFDVDTTALTPPPIALPQEPKKDRKRWTDGNRRGANPAGKWLVVGPYTPRYNDDPVPMTTSKTLIRGGGRQNNGVWNSNTNALSMGDPNTNDPNPRNPKVMQSDVVDHGFRANRHARRAS